MLRLSLCVASMATAFAVGYSLSPAPPGGPPAVDVAAVDGELFPSSTHVKSPAPRPATAQTRMPGPSKKAEIAKKIETAKRQVTIESLIASLPKEPEVRLPLPPAAQPPLRQRPLARTLTKLVAFEAAPFPYDGVMPRSNQPFLNFQEDGRQAHKTFSGRVYWADQTYSDRRVLLHIPQGFDANKPSVMVLFFHGHGATLERDVLARQRVPEQITDSGINAVLVAPQFAVDARDSSAGNFWKPGGARRFLDEVADKLAAMYGNPGTKRTFTDMPVIIVGYSGGYVPTAWTLAKGGVGPRVKGVVLLDGLYGEIDKFAAWIEKARTSGFFLSAFTHSTRRGNDALRRILARRDIPYRTKVERNLGPGSVVFIAANERHRHYVTRAWADDPIADVLIKLSGVAPRETVSQSASLLPGLAR